MKDVKGLVEMVPTWVEPPVPQPVTLQIKQDLEEEELIPPLQEWEKPTNVVQESSEDETPFPTVYFKENVSSKDEQAVLDGVGKSSETGPAETMTCETGNAHMGEDEKPMTITEPLPPKDIVQDPEKKDDQEDTPESTQLDADQDKLKKYWSKFKVDKATKLDLPKKPDDWNAHKPVTADQQEPPKPRGRKKKQQEAPQDDAKDSKAKDKVTKTEEPVVTKRKRSSNSSRATKEVKNAHTSKANGKRKATTADGTENTRGKKAKGSGNEDAPRNSEACPVATPARKRYTKSAAAKALVSRKSCAYKKVLNQKLKAGITGEEAKKAAREVTRL